MVALPSTTAQVSAGRYHTCGLETDGTVVCWGDNYYGQRTPPADAFAQVSAGGVHTCGVKTDGTVGCWGDNSDGQRTPPAHAPGAFAQVSAGGLHTCGLKPDGTVVCWGYDDYGQRTPPAHAVGAFAQVSAGGYHTCALWTDGTAVCWGYNFYGQAPRLTLQPETLPDGTAGSPYSQIVSADGGTGPYAFSLAAESLPPGLVLYWWGPVLGTLSAGGTYTFTIRATDCFTLPFSGRREYVITVDWPYHLFVPVVLRQ